MSSKPSTKAPTSCMAIMRAAALEWVLVMAADTGIGVAVTARWDTADYGDTAGKATNMVTCDTGVAE